MLITQSRRIEGASVLRSAYGNAATPHYPIWVVIAAWAYFVFRLLRSARTQERRRLEEGQQHTKRDTALLLLAALFLVGLLLGAIFLVPSISRAGFYAIAV
jgi:hypothetical protein